MNQAADQGDEADAIPDLADPASVEALWDKYYPRLKAAVRNHVRSMRSPVADESEIALSAFHSLIRQVNEGRFPDLESQDRLWLLLKTIAVCKAKDLRRHLRAKKRGGGRPSIGQTDLKSDDNWIQEIGDVSDPVAADLEISEIFNALLANLPTDRYRDIVLLKLQGASVATIAECLSISTRTVHRMLASVEQRWRRELL